MSHILQHAVESIKVLLTLGEATIPSQDSDVEDLKDLWICSKKVRLRGCRRQVLHIQGNNKVHATEGIFRWMKG